MISKLFHILQRLSFARPSAASCYRLVAVLLLVLLAEYIPALQAVASGGEKALQFGTASSSDDFAEAVGSFPTNNQPRTLMFWARSFDGTREGNSDHMVNYGAAINNAAFGAMLYIGNRWWFYAHNYAVYDIDTELLADKDWHFHTVRYDGVAVSYFFDGKLLRSVKANLQTVPSNMFFGIRPDHDLGNTFNGIIDEVSLWNRGLTQTEITAARNRKLSGQEDGLIGYWNFDEDDGQVIYDSSPNKFHGWLGSTPEIDVHDPMRIPSDVPISTTPFEPVELIGLEVTQAIQNWKNEVVLLEGKPTFVRAHVRSRSGMIEQMTAQLSARRDGRVLSPPELLPANIGGTITVLEKPDRAQINDSFYFQLPSDWSKGTVELEVRGVSNPIVCAPSEGSNTSCKVTITFKPAGKLEVKLIGVSWKESNGTRHTPSEADFTGTQRALASMMPVSDVDVQRSTTINLEQEGAPLSRLDMLKVSTRIAWLRASERCVDPLCKRVYIGVLVDPPTAKSGDVFGHTTYNSAVAGYFTPSAPHILPHELGHVYGRSLIDLGPLNLADNEHVSSACKTLPEGDKNYPYKDGMISNEIEGDGAFYGFDIYSVRTRIPDTPEALRIYGPSTGDLMSYCYPAWPSKYTYERIRGKLPFTSQLSMESTSSIEQPIVLVSGSLSSTSGTAGFEAAYQFQGLAGEVLTGTYTLRFDDAAGLPIASYPFEPEFCDHCPQNVEPNGFFVLALPWDSRTSRMTLLHNGREMATRRVSAHSPQVRLLSPKGGEVLAGAEVTIQWAASDMDSDVLSYAIQYSNDNGISWQTLNTDWTMTSYTIPRDQLPGSSQARIRILASDGMRTGSDISDDTFTNVPRAPSVTIFSSRPNSMYVSGQTITLDGSAFDPEDGQISDAGLTWYSDRSGVLGTGRQLIIDSSILAQGRHTITLTARDNDQSIGQATTTLDVFRVRPELPAVLALAPADLQFTVYEGGSSPASKTLSLRNDGDGSLSWVAEADQPWLSLGEAAGVAPKDVTISVNPAGLEVGVYRGTITVSGSGESGSRSTIVTLTVLPKLKVYLPLTRL